MLLRELEYTPQQAHSSDVVALAEGAEESTLEMGVTQKVRHLLCELGGLLPFFADNDGEALRSLVAATLSWLQRAEGTIVEVNSQGDAETQPVNMTPHSLFGESHRGGAACGCRDGPGAGREHRKSRRACAVHVLEPAGGCDGRGGA